jgi:hypothetical protein
VTQHAGRDLVCQTAIGLAELRERALASQLKGNAAVQVVENAPGGGARG